MTEQRALAALAKQGKQPIGSVTEELYSAATEVVALKDFLREHLERLRTIARTDKLGREEVRAGIAAYERALDRTVAHLVSIAKLNLEERLTKLAEAQGDLLGRWLIWFVESAIAYLDVEMDDDRWNQMRYLVRTIVAELGEGNAAPRVGSAQDQALRVRPQLALAPRVHVDGPST